MLPEMSLSTGQICMLLWIGENEKGKSVERNFLSIAYHFHAKFPSLYQVVLSQATKVTEVAVVETVSTASFGWILSWFGSPLQCSKNMTAIQKTCVHDIAWSGLQRMNQNFNGVRSVEWSSCKWYHSQGRSRSSLFTLHLQPPWACSSLVQFEQRRFLMPNV